MKIYRYNQEIQENNQENENDIKKEIKRNQMESSGMEDRQRKNNKSMIRVTGGEKNKTKHSGPEIIFNTLISENFPKI